MLKFITICLGLFVWFSGFAQIPPGYYDTVNGLTGTALKDALNDIIDGHTEFPYTSSATDTWDILKLTDQDPNNSSNVICIYSGFSRDAAAEYNSGAGWNREHVWAKSRGDFGTSKGAGTDIHHLRAADVSTNSARSNRNFVASCDTQYVDGDGTTDSYTCTSEFSWEPRDEVKGDVARMMFYMATRYEGENGEPDLELTETLQGQLDKDPLHATLSVLVAWHEADPVSTIETDRNDIIYSYQGNRNPFIDHPEYVGLIWGSSSSTPTVTVSTTSLAFGNVIFGNSSILSYSVSGLNLTNDIDITPPTNYELSLVSDFSSTIYTNASPLTLTQSSGSVASTTIYVRFTPPSASGLDYNGTITHTSTGATQQDVTVSGKEGAITIPNAWINEFHYDDASTDEGELVEIIVEDYSWDLSLLTVTFYNGGDDSEYASYTVQSDYTLGNQHGSYKVFHDDLPVNGIQNGPDGIALSYNGELIQFLSYEGSFTAADGPASGITSTDIGVSETGSESPGNSVQLSNSGSNYNDFTWNAPSAESPGSLNTGQTLNVGVNTSPTNLDFGLVNFGETSSVRSYTVDGTGLASNLTVTPPVNYELSLVSDFSSTIYSNSSAMTLTPTNGTISTTTVFVRFTPPANDRAVSSGNITHVSGSLTSDVSVTAQEGSFPNAWVNEIHYDNIGTDSDEFFEIVIENASEYLPLSDFTVTLYNGSNGTSYASYDLDPTDMNITTSTVDDFSFYAYALPSNGMQNGGPDGIVLDYQGTIIQFLSYEGSFTAVSGIAIDASSIDIGVTESNSSTATGTSLQLCCNGNTYESQSWQTSATSTAGTANLNQVLPVELISFTGKLDNGTILIEWETASELNNSHFILEKMGQDEDFYEICRLDGKGTISSPTSYQFRDHNIYGSNFYRLNQVDFDGTLSTYDVIAIYDNDLEAIRVWPNPFSSFLKVRVSSKWILDSIIQILDINGVVIYEAKEGANTDEISKHLESVTPGTYFLRFKSGDRINNFKLLKNN